MSRRTHQSWEGSVPLRWVLALLLAPAAAPAAAQNLLQDVDGDGAPDTAWVADWDGDGTLEMDDVQAAVDALTDAGPKRVNVRGGVYMPPDGVPTGRGLIELPSQTTLYCVDETVELQGLAAPPLGPDVSVATVTNSDHVAGNTDVVIANCEITGGMPDAYDASSWQGLTRMGVWFQSVTRGRVEDSFVHHTLHACLYAKNSREIRYSNNLLEDCGGYGNVSHDPHQPAIYLYAVTDAFAPTGGLTEHVWLSGNVVRRAGHSGINLRRHAITDLLRDIVLEDNVVEDTRAQVASCLVLRGADGVTVRRQSCLRTGSLTVGLGAGGYLSGVTPHVNSLRGLLLDDVEVAEVGSGPGIQLGGFLEDVTLLDVTVRGTASGSPCVVLEAPMRKTRVDGLNASECSGEGLLQRGCGASSTPAAGLVLRGIHVDGTDVGSPLNGTVAAGIRFEGRIPGLLLEDVEVSQASGSGIDFGPNAVVGVTLRNIMIDGVPAGFLGRMPAAALPLCTSAIGERWAIVSDAAGLGGCGGGGDTAVVCRCQSGAWVPAAAGPPRYGLHVRNGGSADVLLDSVRVSNVAGAYGIRLDGAPARFAIVEPTGVDDSQATELDQLGAVDASADAEQLSVAGALCTGTDPGSPCVRTDLSHPDLVDGDQDGVGDVCEPRCALGFELVLIAPLLARLARRRSR